MSKKKNKAHKKSPATNKSPDIEDPKQLGPSIVQNDEASLDLESAKTLTVEEASQKQAEIEAGVTADDNLLDRYIKQHRDAIEAEKFETKQNQATLVTDEMVVNSSHKQAESEEPVVAEQTVTPEPSSSIDGEETSVVEPVATVVSPANPETPVEEDRWWEETSPVEQTKTPFFKRKSLWITLLSVLGILGIAWTVYSNLQGSNKGTDGSSTSKTSQSSSRKTSSSSSSSENDAALTEFEALYGTFFTDDQQSALKNEAFGQLTALETALAALEGTDGYEDAKAKFDKLKAAIEATDAINQQFDKPILVNGEVDTTATVKADATFTAPATGLTSIDADLTSAINFGRSQLDKQVTAPASTPSDGTGQASGATATPAPTAPSSPVPATPSTPSNPSTLTNGVVLDYGKRVVYGSDTVELQRHLSRVPYDDTAIARADDPAWTFEPNVLERIIATSNQRGYFAGNDFILEKVNIINGRGYYNLFKTDGTYLFSINAKTGYFVGNGSGYADGLDF